MASVDVGIGLLGYGTVGSSVNRMLLESADEIERATGHRLRVVRALVREPAKERPFPAGDGVLTTDFGAFRDDPEVQIVAEVMGGLAPAGDYVRDLLRAGKPVVSANKQLIARDGAELFAIAARPSSSRCTSCATETSCAASLLAVCASTPGRSATSRCA